MDDKINIPLLKEDAETIIECIAHTIGSGRYSHKQARHRELITIIKVYAGIPTEVELTEEKNKV